MKKYVSRHWDTKIELKNQWFLSLGYGFISEEEPNIHQYYEKDYITNEQLKISLDYMAEIINTIGVPQIGSYFYDDASISKIYEIEYRCDSKNLHINLVNQDV